MRFHLGLLTILFQNWSAQKDSIPRPASDNCGSLGLHRPVLLLKLVPFVQDGLTRWPGSRGHPSPQTWSSGPSKHGSFSSTTTKPVYFGKSFVMRKIPRKRFETKMGSEPFSRFFFIFTEADSVHYTQCLFGNKIVTSHCKFHWISPTGPIQS